jgi:hypothetical protein
MSRRNDISVLCAVMAAALAATPAVADPLPVDSWGRAGVAYETYRNDSLECGLVGYYADVSQTKEAQAFVTATRRLEDSDTTSYASPGASPAQAMDALVIQARQYEQIRRSIRPEQKVRALKQGMEAVVQDCLRERGYVQFRLTDDQREMLAKLDKGSDERREYLYSLASNPEVLNAQALERQAS